MRPVLTREARERCRHGVTTAIRSNLPNSYGGRQWCRMCGAFFVITASEATLADVGEDNADLVGATWIRSTIDWPATEAADREQIEAEGQIRLPE